MCFLKMILCPAPKCLLYSCYLNTDLPQYHRQIYGKIWLLSCIISSQMIPRGNVKRQIPTLQADLQNLQNLLLCLGLVILPIETLAIQFANSNRPTGGYNSGFHSVWLLAAKKIIRQLLFSQSFLIYGAEIKFRMDSLKLFHCKSIWCDTNIISICLKNSQMKY